jgi:drug/metabolite transporter (DMT)-like permease
VAIVFSVLCAIVYGSADFCGGIASRRTPVLGVVAGAQGFGFVLLLAVAPLFGGSPGPADWFWGGACGVAGAGAIALLYRGLAIGTMGVVSPITAVLAAIVPIAYAVVGRAERPSWLALAGIVAAMVAVVCVSAVPGETAAPGPSRPPGWALPPGLLEAFGSGIGFGILFVALAQIGPGAGMYPLLAARVVSLVLLAAGGVAIGRAGDLRIARPALGLVVATSVMDVSANVLFVLAAHLGMLSIVAVLSSLYPAATVALAAVVLHERLVRIQWVGVAIALGGVAAISASH